jgi:DNA gyrase subunit A
MVVSEKGYGKRTAVDEYRITNRGGKGVKTINVTEKTGKLVGILDVLSTEDLMITCTSGITIRMSVGAISELGRATQGVKLIRLDEGDEIAAITKLDEEEPEKVDEIDVENGILPTEISLEANQNTESTENIDPQTPIEPTETPE